MHRRARFLEIRRRLNGRRLVWFGTRGTDAQPLLEFPEFDSVFSQTAPLEAISTSQEICLETLMQQRVDLNVYSIDADRSAEAADMHRKLIRTLREPCVLATYRPCAFLTSAYYPRLETCQYLGLFHERQAAFEHKPWVEVELQKHDVRVVPWRYFDDEDRLGREEALAAGPLVLRANRTDGGAGLTLVKEAGRLGIDQPVHGDGFLAAAPFLVPNIPLNVNACVFRDGSITMHAPSLQLIGLDACTGRPFGYCGNDFAAIADLDTELLDEFDHMVQKVGLWLASEGYVGAFGVDAIVYRGHVYLAEINPRFQGSSAAAAHVVSATDRPHLFLDHLAAFYELPAPAPVPLRVQAREQMRLSQISVYNRSLEPAMRHPDARFDAERVTCKLVPAEGVKVDPEGLLFKVMIHDAVTKDGASLTPDYDTVVRRVVSHSFASVSHSR